MSGAAHRAGTIAIVGRPNVGKSTLLNRLIGQKMSITSRKPQTTRHRITGILTRPDAQIVFVDTPGFQNQHRSTLTRIMNRAVTQALTEVDVVVWVIEALRYDARDDVLMKRLPDAVPVILVLNKVDRVKAKAELLPFIAGMSGRRSFAAIVPLSAERDADLDALVAEMVSLLPEGPAAYGEEEVTTLSERFLAAELVREKLFRLLGEELPYSTAVEIERFETREDLRRIHAVVIVDKANQKPIVIGRNGEKLKAISSSARRDMEALFGSRVYLEVWVRVRSGWADDAAALKRLGHD